MIVVADTTPLNYLLLIDRIDLLPALYEKVFIPPEVHRELRSAKTPASVLAWSSALPPWCSVQRLNHPAKEPLFQLDPGEREAIQLALELSIGTLLIDDGRGRIAAAKLNLRVNGTLAVLELAARRGLTNFRESLLNLEQTNFRVSANIREDFLRRNP